METQESKDEMLSVKVASNKRANVKIKKTPKVQIFTTSDHEEDVVKSSNNSVSIFDTPLIKSPKILKKASKKLKKPLSEKNNAKKTSKKATEVKADPSLNKNSPSKEIIEKENITSPVLAVNDNENKTETKKDTQEKKKKTIATVKTRASKIGNRSSFPEAVKKAEKAKSTRHSTACELKNQPQNKRNSVVFNVFTPKLNDESKPPRTPSPNPLQKKVQMERDVALLESIFPNIDPAFLKIQYLKMKRSVEDTVDLIAVRKTKGEAPTKKAQFNKSAIESFLKKYTTEFSVESFLKAIPDPWNYFLNSELHNSIRYAELSLEYLKNKHTKHYVQTIENTLVSCEYSLYRSNKELSNKRKNLMFKMRRTNRKNDYGSGEFPIVDFQFVQEVAFVEHEKEIIEQLKKMEDEKFQKRKDILKLNGLFRCRVCLNGNLMLENIVTCKDDHVICKDCINSYVEREVGNRNFEFKCPLSCGKLLPLESIQDILKTELLAIIVRRNLLEELKSAGIDDVVYCPHCYYIKIMPSPEQSIFYCMNPSCMKESCRACKDDNHDPLTCGKVNKWESNEDNFNSNLPICIHCKKEFIKTDDNVGKMICPCGCLMCYICREPYPNCPHFKTETHEENDLSIAYSTNEGFPKTLSEETKNSRAEYNCEVESSSTFLDRSTDLSPNFVSSDSEVY